MYYLIEQISRAHHPHTLTFYGQSSSRDQTNQVF